MVRMSRPPLLGEAKAAEMIRRDADAITLSAGPLAGRFSNSVKVAVAGAMLIAAAIVTFVVALLSGTDFPQMSMALWIIGWILVMAGVVFVGLAAHIRAEKEARLEEEIFKTEPRTIGLDHTTPRIVMVRCKYCGTLNAEDASKCHSCGATL